MAATAVSSKYMVARSPLRVEELPLAQVLAQVLAAEAVVVLETAVTELILSSTAAASQRRLTRMILAEPVLAAAVVK